MKKMEMTKFITFQMLQSEHKCKQMMIQGQLQLVVFFYKCVETKDHKW
jgi:hypothetical protein